MEQQTVFDLAQESLEKVGDMAEELEFKNQYFLDEIQKLSDSKDDLQTEIRRVNKLVAILTTEANDHQRWYKSSGLLQVALSILAFTYGMVYGAYFKC